VGYSKLKGTPKPDTMWLPIGTGMGTVSRWNTTSTYWAKFDAAMHTNPPIEGVWMMLCSHDKDAAANGQFSPDVLEAQARQHINDIRHRTNAPIYGTPMFRYLDSSCPQVVKAQPATELLVQKFISEGLVRIGPILTPMKASQLANGRCDQNVAGRTVHAADLRAFFG
jgi:hypothetical protein